MQINLKEFGQLIKAFREAKNISQKDLSDQIRNIITTRNISNIENGIFHPDSKQVTEISHILGIPQFIIENYIAEDFQERFDFESSISELFGEDISLKHHDQSSISVVNLIIRKLNTAPLTPNQQLDTFNSILGFYGIKPISNNFFQKYFKEGLNSKEKLDKGVESFQIDAIRLYSNLNDAYIELSDHETLEDILQPLQPKDTEHFKMRSEWSIPCELPQEELSYLGYISAEKMTEEAKERKELKDFLIFFAKRMETEDLQTIFSSITEKEKSKMDHLMRKFDVRIEHGLYSSLFAPSPSKIAEEANRLQPTEDNVQKIKETQKKALINLSAYLSSDHLDVYVATSMRNDADFISVNNFVKKIFNNDLIREYKLRYFNPTQSWIEERIAKGLVEALMLKRSMATIYMAQKTDTFGKDSEASVALGQGKPVIVYVPKLYYQGLIDSEDLFNKNTNELFELIFDKTQISDTKDHQIIFAKLLEQKIEELDDYEITDLTKLHLADLDLLSESYRIKNTQERDDFEKWINSIESKNSAINNSIRKNLINIIIATTINFEKRARLFKVIHPLALQVVLSSGVLNGMLVVRSAEQCAKIMDCIIKNSYDIFLKKDESNIQLVEKTTLSTIRVVSKHALIKNSFKKHFYGK